MQLLTFTWVVVLAVTGLSRTAVAQPTPSCPSNQIFTTCGTACQETCTGKSAFCTQQCVIGCQCAPGFVKHGDSCITKAQCPGLNKTTLPPRPNTTCSANQVFKSCGTACPETCEGRSFACTRQCVIGCQCAAGYVKHNDTCITRAQCPVTKPHAGHHSGFPGRPHPGGNRGFPGHLYPGGNRRNGSHPNPHRHYDDDDGMGTDEPHDGDSLFDHEQQPSRGEHDTHRQHQTTATGAPARHSTELHKKHRRQGIIFTPLNIALCAGVAVLFCVLMLACLRRRAKARRDATLDTVGYNVMRDEVI